MNHDSEEYSDFNVPHNQFNNFSVNNNRKILPGNISSTEQQNMTPQMGSGDLLILEQSIEKLE